jgi:nucleotide-binding universal stress UspA family protein
MTVITQTPITLLAAIDYSELSPLVIAYSIDLMRQNLAGQAHFLHVSSTSPSTPSEASRRNAQLLAWLGDRLKETERVPEPVTLVAHEAHGDPAKVIVQTASDLEADVLIVGTHGRTGMQRVMMGSTAETVVRHAGCPVLVVRPKAHEHVVPEIEPPCPRCVTARVESQGRQFWCEQHEQPHRRRHTYYDSRAQTWVNQRLVL